MHHGRALVALGVVLLGLLFLGGILLYTNNRPVPEYKAAPNTVLLDRVFDPVTEKNTIHGFLTLPDKCADLQYGVEVSGENSENVLIRFDTKASTEDCTERLARREFTLSYRAPQDARLRATLNGEPYDLKIRDSF